MSTALTVEDRRHVYTTNINGKGKNHFKNNNVNNDIVPMELGNMRGNYKFTKSNKGKGKQKYNKNNNNNGYNNNNNQRNNNNNNGNNSNSRPSRPPSRPCRFCGGKHYDN